MTTKTTTIHLSVEGMMCQRNCGTTVRNALLSSVPGAMEAQADYARQTAWVRVAGGTAADELYENAIEAVEVVGFEGRPMIHLQVLGMMCQKNCGTTVENALKAVPGIASAQAWFGESRAVAILENSRQNIETMRSQLVEAIENVGFEALPVLDFQKFLEESATISDQSTGVQQDSTSSSQSLLLAPSQRMDTFEIEAHDNNNENNRIVLSVSGMSCAVCTGRVERCLLETRGVWDATVVLSTQTALVQLDEEAATRCGKDKIGQACCEAVQLAGYSCQVVEQSVDLRQDAMRLEQARQKEAELWRNLFIFSIAILIPMGFIMMGFIPLGMSRVPTGNLWLMFLLSTAIQYGTGKRYYLAAWKGWINGRVLGMDALIVLGTTASYTSSLILFLTQLFTGRPTLMEPTFMTNAMLLTFITLGKYLECYARGKTADAVHKLMELQPSTAFRVIDERRNFNDIAALTTEEVSISEIRPGDFVRVLPGGQIPADGILVAVSSKSSGGYEVPEAFIDESAFSGEAFPVTKTVGDVVFGGTINQLSVLVVRVTASGNHTCLAKIVRLVEEAQRHKAPIQAYADRLAAVFAPVVVGIALVTFVAWLCLHGDISLEARFFVAFMTSISVVVVACPCALGLATPTAVMVGTGVGATQGILIKGGDVLEHMHTVDTVIFDKTGTLTCGKAELSDRIGYLNDYDQELLTKNLPSHVTKDTLTLWLALCAEAQSEHPLAQAIIKAGQGTWGDSGVDLTGAQLDGVCIDEFLVQPGRGVECRVGKPNWGSRIVRVGSREWTKADPNSPGKLQSDDDPTGDKDADNLRRQGKIAFYLSVLDDDNGSVGVEHSISRRSSRRVIGVFGIVDHVKPEARSTVAALQKMGVNVLMCTGDNEVTALAVARAIGLAESKVYANVGPQAKADLVTQLQKGNELSGSGIEHNSTKILCQLVHSSRGGRGKVAMVADGVNDAVALARADVGIAIGAGTEIALEAADVVLVQPDLGGVAVAFHLSSIVFQRILLNFFLAMCYNVIAVPFAAGLFYPFTDFRLPPELAGMMMATSSVCVVTSSLMLRMYRRPTIEADGSLKVRRAPWLERMERFVRLRPLEEWSGYRNVSPSDDQDIV